MIKMPHGIELEFNAGSFYIVKCGSQPIVGKLGAVDPDSDDITFVYFKCIGQKQDNTCFVEPGFGVKEWMFSKSDVLYQLKDPTILQLGKRAYHVFPEINDCKLFG